MFTAFQPNAFQSDAFQIRGGAAALVSDGAFGGGGKKRRKRQRGPDEFRYTPRDVVDAIARRRQETAEIQTVSVAAQATGDNKLGSVDQLLADEARVADILARVRESGPIPVNIEAIVDAVIARAMREQEAIKAQRRKNNRMKIAAALLQLL